LLDRLVESVGPATTAIAGLTAAWGIGR